MDSCLSGYAISGIMLKSMLSQASLKEDRKSFMDPDVFVFVTIMALVSMTLIFGMWLGSSHGA